MQVSDILTLYEYNYWANQHLLDVASQLSEAQFAAPVPVSHKSVRGTLVHVMSAEWLWRSRLQEGVFPTAMLDETDFPTVGALRLRWENEEQTMRAYLSSLTDEALNGVVHYRTTKGTPASMILWHALFQVINHGMQHRSEAAVVLTSYGYSPGDIDFTLYLRELKD
jgi:uncharacterized damage-inducible protein DinB